MNDNNPIIGKNVNDMYGSLVGRAIGTATDIDGSIVSVGIEQGYSGILVAPYERLVIQEEAIVYIPQWRLDSQKMLREKGLITRRLRALKAIHAENSDLREETETIQKEYESRLNALNEKEQGILDGLDGRLGDLAQQAKTAKAMLFDATIQYKSSEMFETDFKVVKGAVNDALDRVRYETDDIKNMQRRLEELGSDQTEEEEETITEIPEAPTEPVEDTAEPEVLEPTIPEPPKEAEPPRADWMTRMNSQ